MSLTFQTFRDCITSYDKSLTYLLAMSGGRDSSVLFDLLLKSEMKFVVAHANFGLRGNASDEDEKWVEELCMQHCIPYYGKKFDLKGRKQKENLSTQMAARDARYAWFEEILQDGIASKILTAHHQNDALETFFINLSRGSGLRGLIGIPENDKLLRPLLSFSSEEIGKYAQENNLSWREDPSNATDDYLRNRIRHHVTPILDETLPDFTSGFAQSIQHLNQAHVLLEYLIKKEEKSIFKQTEDCVRVALEKLETLPEKSTFLHFTMRKFGFHSTAELEKMMHAQTGAEITSSTHRLLKNREQWLIMPIQSKFEEKVIISEKEQTISFPFSWKFNISTQEKTNFIISLDFQTLKFPLSLRFSNPGDVFYPIGMNGKSKKVSKFFKDEKFSKFEKENTWLLCDADDNIIWIVGHRADERFKTTKETTKWLYIENYNG